MARVILQAEKMKTFREVDFPDTVYTVVDDQFWYKRLRNQLEKKYGPLEQVPIDHPTHIALCPQGSKELVDYMDGRIRRLSYEELVDAHIFTVLIEPME